MTIGAVLSLAGLVLIFRKDVGSFRRWSTFAVGVLMVGSAAWPWRLAPTGEGKLFSLLGPAISGSPAEVTVWACTPDRSLSGSDLGILNCGADISVVSPLLVMLPVFALMLLPPEAAKKICILAGVAILIGLFARHDFVSKGNSSNSQRTLGAT